MADLDHYSDDAAAIDALRPVNKQSDRIRVMAIAPRITDALERGVSWAAIEQCLRRNGITATLQVIKNYYRTAGKKAPSRKRQAKPINQTTQCSQPASRIVRPPAGSRGESEKASGESVQKIRPDSTDL